MQGTLTLREYETARIGPRWDAGGKVVSRHEVAALDRHQRETGQKCFELGYRSIRATNWVGVIGLGKRSIEVIPKIEDSDSKKVRENLLHMVSIAGLVPISEADITSLANSNKSLLAAYMELYVQHLDREWRTGQIRRYVVREENRTCLKGKLLLPKHLRNNLLHGERFFTASDEFLCDNPVSQLLKAALRRCRDQRFSHLLGQKAKSVLPEFDEVSDVEFPAEAMQAVVVDRCISRFAPLLAMAKFILREVSPSTSTSASPVYSLLFDMNVVFERFIASELRAAMRHEPVRVKYQVRGKSLLLKSGKKQFRLLPDMGVFSKQQNLCMIDTKWKRLNMDRPHSNVSQADVYQMYAYGKEYNSPRVILLYPQHGSLPQEVADYEHSDRDPGRQILVRTIDVSQPLRKRAVRNRLRASLHSMAMETD